MICVCPAGNTAYTYKFLQQYSKLIGKTTASSVDALTANGRKITRAIAKKKAAPPLRPQKPFSPASSKPQAPSKLKACDLKAPSAAAAAVTVLQRCVSRPHCQPSHVT